MDGFFIFTRRRSGSSAVVDALNQHPDITCFQEVFRLTDLGEPGPVPFAIHDGSLRSYLRYLSGLARVDGKAAFGFKYMPGHNRHWKKYKPLKVFARRGFRALHLKRSNFRIAVSLAVAANRGNFNPPEDQEPCGRLAQEVEIDPAEVLERTLKAQALNQKIARQLKKRGITSIEIDYEDFDGNPLEALNRVTGFLGVPPFENAPARGDAELPPDDPADFVTNLAEIRRHFQRAGHGALVD